MVAKRVVLNVSIALLASFGVVLFSAVPALAHDVIVESDPKNGSA